MIPGIVSLGLLLLVACSGEPATGPEPVALDRDTCAHCAMLIGDERFAAQVRTTHDHRIQKFDDLGCALHWVDENVTSGSPEPELWVGDHAGEGWLNGHEAAYVGGQQTPMDYGYAASSDPGTNDVLGLDEVRALILAKERKGRGGHH